VFLALLDPGDEVLIFEPFYENYGPDAILCDAKPVFVPLTPPDWQFDADVLRRAITPRARALVLNSPHNPTGHVFSREELGVIASICIEHDLMVFTDDPYEYIIFSGEHVPMATLPGMRERTVTISGLSKTFSCTGWRLGYAIAPAEQSQAIRKVHDFLTVGAPAPLQAAGAVGMAFGADYYNQIALEYRARRDVIVRALEEAGFRFSVPEGAYYVLVDFSDLSGLADDEFARWLTREIGVAPVPGSSFYHDAALGRRLVRFAFCKKLETLERAGERLANVRASV
jgi:aminotransferase